MSTDPSVAPPEQATQPAPGPSEPTAPTDPPAPADPAAATPPPPAPPAPAPADPSAATPPDPAPPADPPAPVSPDVPAPQETGDVLAELDKLRQQIADLETKTSSSQASLAQTDQELASKVDQLRKDFDAWPQRGDQYADKPQPWDLQQLGLPQPGVTRDHLPGGEPDPLSPVVIAHNKPLLTAGMAGDAVAELADLLKQIGYTTSISEGRNFSNSFDDTVAAAVSAFRRDFHVAEDPSQWPQDAHAAERFVGPWTWEALIRAARLTQKAA